MRKFQEKNFSLGSFLALDCWAVLILLLNATMFIVAFFILSGRLVAPPDD